MGGASSKGHRYTMRISRLTVDKLGVKLYDRVSAVIAELIANAYDADAKVAEVEAPMGQLLAQQKGKKLVDKGYQIVVRDDGHGMTPEEVNDFYLRVGRERRLDPLRGDHSRELKRRVMGRKGVGKLAPFGICNTIEVISSGGPKTKAGYLTAHLILEKDKILTDSDEEYHPRVGANDGSFQKKRGTTLVLTGFSHRHVPALDEFARQISQRFGIETADWRISLRDNVTPKSKPRIVGAFDVETMAETYFELKQRGSSFVVLDGNKKVRSDLSAGFEHSGSFYSLTGWVAYAKHPYKDDLMAGIRIYCRGKIAAQTSVFNRKAGFTGEHDVRSYLVGELHADWLDADEDLIQTDRRDILWSHELGQRFEEWGQKLVVQLGRMTRDPMRKRAWENFQTIAKLDERILKAFPAKDQADIRRSAKELGRLVGQSLRQDELADKTYVESLVQLTLQLSPHVALTDKLREAADAADSPLQAVSGLLRTARVAELSAFGLIAEDRVRVIERVAQLKDEPKVLEAAFQDLITQAPWLIDPQWSPITANQSFETLRQEFQKLYKKKTGNELVLVPFSTANKRADFVMTLQEGEIQIVEIKKPGYAFDEPDFKRLVVYIDLMTQFLADPGHQDFRRIYPSFHVTLVCDGIKLGSISEKAFQSLKDNRKLTHINWNNFLLKTRRMHEDFLKEAQRQKRDAARS